MIMRWTITLAVLVAGSPGVATAQSGPAAGEGAANLEPSGTLVKDDQQLIKKLYQSNQAQLEMAYIARSNADSSSVQTLAERLIDEHKRVGEQLTQLAAKRGMSLGKPKDRDHPKLAEPPEIERLRVLQGPVFDREFVAETVTAHEQLLGAVDRGRVQATDGALRDLLDQIRPTLEHDRLWAEDLSRERTG
jgi:putative membrane protein